MEFKFEYSNETERESIINSNQDKYLVSVSNTSEGNILVFTTIMPLKAEVEELKKDNTLLKAQNNALTERTDFHEDLIAEMAMIVYP